MAKTKEKQQKLIKKPNPAAATSVKKLQKKKKSISSAKLKSKHKLEPVISSPSSSSEADDSSNSSSSSDSDVEANPERIQKLLEPYSKEQLIDLVVDSALSNPTLLSKIEELADKDITHRKIFVHGLSWSTTNETLNAEFGQFGEIENCSLIMDKATGKTKGYAFVTFKSRKSAVKALEQPKKLVDNRIVSCQLAALGPPSGSTVQQDVDVGMVVNASERKIYVNNVSSDVNPDRLRSFFASFGEIENGPTGFDPNTGKFKGYALFVYRTLEGAKKALEEPNKIFEGRQLRCQKAKAVDGKKIGGGASGITTSVQPVPPVYASLAGVQNTGLFAQNPNASITTGLMNLNALYAAGLYGTPNAAAGLINVNPYGAYGQVPGGGVPMGMGVGGYSGVLGGYGLGSLGSGSSTTGLVGGAGSFAGGAGSFAGGAGSLAGGAASYAGGAGSFAGGAGPPSQPVMQGLSNAYPSTMTAQKPSSALTPSINGHTS